MIELTAEQRLELNTDAPRVIDPETRTLARRQGRQARRREFMNRARKLFGIANRKI